MAGGSINTSSIKSSYSGKDYTRPLMLVTSLFFMWAVALNLNDILIPHLKKACDLTDFESSLIQTAYFGAYFLAALPAGWLMKKVGYKWGIISGLLLCAVGTILFFPAAETRMYGLFLLALFIMASGATFLEVAANPYVTVLGPPATAERRLNLAQAFNGVGAFITPQIGKLFILSGIEHTAQELAAMSPNELEAYRSLEAGMVKIPYLVIAGIFLSIAAFIFFSYLPEIQEEENENSEAASNEKLWSKPHFFSGVIAQFFYVGAQVGLASFMIRFCQFSVAGTTEGKAADYLTFHLIGFMLGRFAGTAIMKYISPARLLTVNALAAFFLVLFSIHTNGMVAIWAVVAVGFFNSIMFPTIFALAIKGLGAKTKMASSYIIMSIVGGALLPAAMGILSDWKNIQVAFYVPAFCYLIVLWYGWAGHKEKLAIS